MPFILAKRNNYHCYLLPFKVFIPKVLIHIYVNNTVSLNEKLSCCLSLYLIKVGRTSSSVTTDASSDLEAHGMPWKTACAQREACSATSAPPAPLLWCSRSVHPMSMDSCKVGSNTLFQDTKSWLHSRRDLYSVRCAPLQGGTPGDLSSFLSLS